MLSLSAVGLGALSLAGCLEEEGPPVEYASDEDGYEPAYYDGYVVYYDAGRPYYYDRGVVVWVSPTSPYYAGLENHWRVYGRGYPRWYGHYGYQYRSYRRAPGYHAYHGYGPAPRGHRR